MPERIHIFDTTLRDGEQSAGVAFSQRDKLEIALGLEKLGVDIIEAGFPRTSPGDFESVQKISETVKNCSICALARAVPADIETAYEAVKKSQDPRIHVFINTSDIQMAHQLKKEKQEVLEQAGAMVKLAASFTSNVEFSPMDATRSDRNFLYSMIQTAIENGASVINVPDSVGYAIPEELGELFQSIRENVKDIDKITLSFHGQNDLGLCTANSLTAIQNGVRQIECTINGIGERAGNTSLEEVVMAVHTRKDLLGFETGIQIGEIYRMSKMVERYSGMPVQWNKAIVGKNAFRHGSGIHQDGILKLRETWEIMDPQQLGIPTGTQLVLGKLSGRHAVKARLEQLGYFLNPGELDHVFEQFKKLADKKGTIDDRDLQALVTDNRTSGEETWQIDLVQVVAGNHAAPTATIRLIGPDGEKKSDSGTGTGPVDAVYHCINKITGLKPALIEFSVKSVTEGIDAQGEVTIRIEDDGIFTGRSSDTDIVLASAKAYLDAVNRMINRKRS